jgi:hypothetical protein
MPGKKSQNPKGKAILRWQFEMEKMRRNSSAII